MNSLHVFSLINLVGEIHATTGASQGGAWHIWNREGPVSVKKENVSSKSQVCIPSGLKSVCVPIINSSLEPASTVVCGCHIQHLQIVFSAGSLAAEGLQLLGQIWHPSAVGILPPFIVLSPPSTSAHHHFHPKETSVSTSASPVLQHPLLYHPGSALHPEERTHLPCHRHPSQLSVNGNAYIRLKRKLEDWNTASFLADKSTGSWYNAKIIEGKNKLQHPWLGRRQKTTLERETPLLNSRLKQICIGLGSSYFEINVHCCMLSAGLLLEVNLCQAILYLGPLMITPTSIINILPHSSCLIQLTVSIPTSFRKEMHFSQPTIQPI